VYDVPIIAKYVTYNFLVDLIARVEVPFRVWVITPNDDRTEKMRDEFFIIRNTFLYDIWAGFKESFHYSRGRVKFIFMQSMIGFQGQSEETTAKMCYCV
jgi:hypothetical protein